MGLKNSKKINTEILKLQKQEKERIKIEAVISEFPRKIDKKSNEISTTAKYLCNQLRNAVIEKSRTSKNADVDVMEGVEKDANVKRDSLKSNHFDFRVKQIDRLDSYVYGSPPTAAVSYLEGMQLKVDDAVTFHLQESGKQVRVDRKLLTLNSDFLCSNLSPEMFTITIRGYSYESIQAVAICLYTKQIHISLNTIYDVFRFCYELRITAILELLTNLCNSCDPIFLLAQLRRIVSENEIGTKYTCLIYDICRNYYRVLQHPAIVDLNFNEMKELVKARDEIYKYLSLDQRCELHVYDAIIDWILHKHNTRIYHCLDLLKHVRFEKLQAEEWKQAFSPNMLQSFPEKLKEIMFRIIETYSIQDINTKLNVFDIHSKLPKIKNIGDLISEDKESKKKIELDESDQDEESEKIIKEALRSFKIIIGTQMLHDLPPEGRYSLSEHSIILLFGGFQSQVPYKTEQGLFMHQLKPFDSGDSRSSTSDFLWSPLSQRLPKTLAHFQALKIGSLIFIIGGIDVSSLLHEKTLNSVNDCCAYSLSNDNWYKLAPMNYPRGYHGSIRINDKIYVFGGISSSSNKTFLTNTFEFLDIRSNTWTEVCTEDEKPCPRMAFGMVYHHDVIWVIGGLTGSVDKGNYASGDLLSDVWIYSLKNEKWRSVEFWRLPKPRAFMASIVFRNQVLLIGGHEVEENTENEQRFMRDSRTRSVIMLRDVSNAWEEGPALNMPRIYPASTVIGNALFVIGGVTHDHKHIEEPVLRSFSGSYEVYNPDINPNWLENSMVFSVHGACAVSLRRSY